MKKAILFGFLLCCAIVYPQKKVTELSLSGSPAAAVLGMQPSATLNPKSLRALEASLYSGFMDDSGSATIPDDFGLEFMPYWFKDHGMSIDEYLFPKDIGTQIARNSSFSLASSQNFKLQDSTATKSIGFGYRTSVFFPSKRDVSDIKQNINKLMIIARVRSEVGAQLMGFWVNNNYATKKEYLDAMKPELQKAIEKNLTGLIDKKEIGEVISGIYDESLVQDFDSTDPTAFFDSVGGIIEKHLTNAKVLNTNYEAFKEQLLKREGLGIDFAYAVLLNFPNNDFEFSVVPRQSLWITPSYSFSAPADNAVVKALAVLRYEWYNKDYFQRYFPATDVFENNFDYGASVSAEYKDFSFQMECTGRSSKSLQEAGTDVDGSTLYRKDSSSDFQYIGTISYRVTDQIAFSYQIGSSFKPVFTPGAGTLISLLSVSFGFGGPSVDDVN